MASTRQTICVAAAGWTDWLDLAGALGSRPSTILVGKYAANCGPHCAGVSQNGCCSTGGRTVVGRLLPKRLPRLMTGLHHRTDIGGIA